MATADSGMVFPLPLPVIISDKPPLPSTLEEQKKQTEALQNQQGFWIQYLQQFGIGKEESQEQNKQIVQELRNKNELDSKKNNKEDQKDRKEAPMNKLREKLSKFWDRIKFWKHFPDLFKNIKEIAKNSYEKVRGWIESLSEWFWYALVDPSGSLITTVVSMMIPALGGLVNLAINMLTSVIPQIINMVIAALPGVMKALERIVLTIVKMAPKFIDAIVKLVPILIKGLVNALPILLKAFIKLFISLFKAVVKLIPILVIGIWDAVKGLWKAFKDAWPELKKAIWEGIVSLWNAMKDAWPAVKDAIYKGIKDFWNSITDLFDLSGTGIEKSIRSISDFFKDMGELLGYIWDDIVKDFNKIYEALGGKEGILKSFEGFKKVIDEIWESVSSFLSDMRPYIEMLVPPLIKLKDILVRVGTILIKGLKWAFDKLMIVIGPVINIILWLVKTIFKVLTPVFVFLIDIVMDIVDVFLSTIEVIGKVIDKLWDWGEIVVKWFVKMWKAVSGWFTDMWDGLTKTFEPMVNFLTDIWDSIVNVVKKGLNSLLGFFSKFFKKAENEVPKTSSSSSIISKPIKPGEISNQSYLQTNYNKSINKTSDVLKKAKEGADRFRNTLNKALDFKAIRLPNLAQAISASISSSVRTPAEILAYSSDAVLGSDTYKYLVKILSSLTDPANTLRFTVDSLQGKVTQLKTIFDDFIKGITESRLFKYMADALKIIISPTSIFSPSSSSPSPLPSATDTELANLASKTIDASKLDVIRTSGISANKLIPVIPQDKAQYVNLNNYIMRQLGFNANQADLLLEFLIMKKKGATVTAQEYFDRKDIFHAQEEGVMERLADGMYKMIEALNNPLPISSVEQGRIKQILFEATKSSIPLTKDIYPYLK